MIDTFNKRYRFSRRLSNAALQRNQRIADLEGDETEAETKEIMVAIPGIEPGFVP